MEEPIRFDIYGIIKKDKKKCATETLAKTRKELQRIELLKEVNHSVVQGIPIKIAHGLGYREAQNVMTQCIWAYDVGLYQEGYDPEESLNYCDIHQLYYGGCVGCHICSGWYQP